jgi:hypothetical protein
MRRRGQAGISTSDRGQGVGAGLVRGKKGSVARGVCVREREKPVFGWMCRYEGFQGKGGLEKGRKEPRIPGGDSRQKPPVSLRFCSMMREGIVWIM